MTPPMSAAASKSQKTNPRSQKGKATAAAADSNGIVPQPSREPIPMKPRRGMFLLLMSIFIAWVGVMLAMYFMTVRPRRHLAPPPAQLQPPAATRSVALGMRMPAA